MLCQVKWQVGYDIVLVTIQLCLLSQFYYHLLRKTQFCQFTLKNRETAIGQDILVVL